MKYIKIKNKNILINFFFINYIILVNILYHNNFKKIILKKSLSVEDNIRFRILILYTSS